MVVVSPPQTRLGRRGPSPALSKGPHCGPATSSGSHCGPATSCGSHDHSRRHPVWIAHDILPTAVRARCVEEARSEEHTSELQSQSNLVCRLLLEKKKKTDKYESKLYTR